MPILDVMITVEGDLVSLKWVFMSLLIKLSDLLPDHIRMNFIDPLKTLLTVMLKYCVSVKVIVNSELKPAKNIVM